MKRNYLFYWFAVLLCLAVPAQSFATVYSGSCGENVNWSLDTETGLLEITGSGVMEGYNSHPNFFEEYRTYSPWYSLRDSITQCRIEEGITNIGRSAFWYCNRLTNINIPEGVTSIASCAFYSCSGLTSIIIPESVTSIGGSAFSYCSGLTSINIPEGVTNIGHAAFYCCYELTNITIPRDLSYITISGDSNPYTAAFERCKKLTSITWNAISFPDTYMSHLDDNLFSSDIREQITSFTFGKEVEKIPRYICYDMKNLTSITIPESVTSIGDHAFYSCTGLTSVTIPNSVTSIESSAFFGCNGLTKVNISDLAAWCSISFEDNPLSWAHHLYLNGTEITDLVIPEGVTSIGSRAFEGCTGLTSITIPESVTSIGEGAFYGCTGLTSITIPESVTSIGDGAFQYCTGLTSVTIPNSVTSIGALAFYACTGLTSVKWNAISCISENNIFDNAKENITSFTFGDKVQTIPSYICSNMKNLTSITIPENVTSVGELAFSGCTGLSDLTWNAISCTTYNSNAFSNNNINSLIIGEEVETIPYEICKEMSNLTNITWNAISCLQTLGLFGTVKENITTFKFGDKVAIIPSNICNGMNKLTSITIPESVTNVKSSAFYGCNGLKEVTWNAISCDLENNVFNGTNENISSFTFGEKVETIPGNICNGMSKLSSIIIPEKVTSIGHSAFDGCSGLTNVTIGNNVKKIEKFTFSDCTSLTCIDIPDNVKSIDRAAFWGCTNLSNVTLGDGIESISDNSFYDCQALTDLVIGKNLKSIGQMAFSNCINLKNVTWNAISCTLSDYAFQLVEITSLTLGKDVEIIPELPMSKETSIVWNAVECSSTNLFSNVKKKIISFTFGEEIKTIPDYICSSMTNLSNVVISNSVTSIGKGAFIGCSNLTNVIIPNYVKNIGNSAFYGCSGLTNITIPESVTSIGERTFSGCSQMERVTCHANIAPSITSLTFNGISSKAVLYYPKGSDYSAWAPYFAQMVEMDYTGIDTPRADDGKDTTYDIYDMSGRMVRKGATTTDGLKAGLYIINGRKVLVE